MEDSVWDFIVEMTKTCLYFLLAMVITFVVVILPIALVIALGIKLWRG